MIRTGGDFVIMRCAPFALEGPPSIRIRGLSAYASKNMCP
jgi:hypothetical protein